MECARRTRRRMSATELISDAMRRVDELNDNVIFPEESAKVPSVNGVSLIAPAHCETTTMLLLRIWIAIGNHKEPDHQRRYPK